MFVLKFQGDVIAHGSFRECWEGLIRAAGNVRVAALAAMGYSMESRR